MPASLPAANAAEKTIVASAPPNGSLRRIGRTVLPIAWAANTAMLLATFLFTYLYAESLRPLSIVREFTAGNFERVGVKLDRSLDGHALLALSAMVMFFATSFVIVGGLFVGGRRFRSLRAWLLFTALSAGWLGFYATWPEVHWLGQQRRISAQLAAAETLAKSLADNWPRADGELPGVGPFMAYPQKNPRTLMPLRFTTIPATNLQVSAIERTEDGAIRFELADEAKVWLEWRALGGRPKAFVSGLETRYNPVRQTQLAPNWFLVRYHTDFDTPRADD